ncbi:MAG TPA: hypothetical protein VEN81_07865, partial [Planctomycetota bacterium]|nr:hypothetical protein [Planctomycetota bacterium]
GSTPKTFPGPWVRISWVQNLVSPNYPALKGEADLRRLWAQVPSQGNRPVWVAARSWVEAAPVYFVARLLGYPVRILEGSMEEEGGEETPS